MARSHEVFLSQILDLAIPRGELIRCPALMDGLGEAEDDGHLRHLAYDFDRWRDLGVILEEGH